MTVLAYEFSGFRLDPRRRLLFGPDGQPVALKPKVFDTLLYFVEHPDELLDKQRLMGAVWGAVVVEENSLNQIVSTLRRVLGEDAGENRFIVTVIGRGYRFVAPVRAATALTAPPAAAPKAPPRRAAMLAAGIAIAFGAGSLAWFVPRPNPDIADGEARLLAVLPCLDRSPDSEHAYVAAGIHEALIDQVAKANFHVIARTSVMPYANAQKSIPQIAHELSVGSSRVDAVIECSVRYAEERLRVGVALADAATSDTLWRDTFDVALGDIFTVESQIALRVADTLRTTLSPAQTATLADVPSRSARAIDFYFSGRRYEQLGTTNWAVAAEQYERAAAEDSQFALAYAQLALLRLSMFNTVAPSPETLAKAGTAAEEALRLAPNLVQGRIAMIGHRALAKKQAPQEALAELAALEPQAQRIYEYYDVRRTVHDQLGRMEEALADAHRAVELGPPQAVPLLLFQTKYHFLLRQYDKAIPIFEHVADIAPDDWGMQLHRAQLTLFRDGDAAALRAMENKTLSGAAGVPFLGAWVDRDYAATLRLIAAEPGPPDSLGKQLNSGLVHCTAGQRELAKPLLEAARDQLSQVVETAPLEPRVGARLTLGIVLGCLGTTEAALRITETALERFATLPPGEAFDMHLNAALAFANAGAIDRAVTELDTYLSNPGVWSATALRRHPLLATFSQDPRLAALLAKHAPG